MKYRRILSIFLCALIVITGTQIPTLADESEVAEVSSFSEEISTLKDFGILTGYTAGTNNLSAPVTRADLAVVAMQLLGIDDIAYASAETKFYDVPKEYWASGYIKVASDMGIISGDNNNNFRPDDNATVNNIIKIIVSVLGYGEIAEFSGGYPNGYLKVANSDGLLAGIKINGDAAITVSQMLKVVYNALNIPILKQYSFGGVEDYKKEDGITILTEYFEIFEEKGIVTGNDKTMLSSTSALDRGSVKIGDKIYNIGTTNISQYLGCNVKFYYKETSIAKYIVSFSVYISDVYDVPAGKLSKYENYQLSYFDENKKLKKFNVSQTVDVIYNGKYKAYFTESDILINNGKLTLVDTDSNGVIDVINVYESITYYVNKVDENKNMVYDTYDQLPLNLYEENDEIITIYDGEQEVDFSRIQPGCILTVVADKLTATRENLFISSDAKIITVYITNDSKSGIFDSIWDEKISIDAVEYEISESFRKTDEFNTIFIPKLGESIKVLLDVFGQVAGMEESDASFFDSIEYGYLTAGSASRLRKLRVYSVNKAVWEDFELANRVKIDGQYKNKKDAYELLKIDLGGVNTDEIVPQLIAFRVNAENMVNYIDTQKLTSDENEATSMTRDDNRNSYRYHLNSLNFGGKIALTNDSKILLLPKLEGAVGGVVDIDDEEGFVTGSTSSFKNSVYYDVETYNTHKAVSNLVICYYHSTTDANEVIPYSNSTTAIVDKVVMSLYDDEFIPKITAFVGSDGGEIEIYCDDNTTVVNQLDESSQTVISARDLKKGDIIRYEYGFNGNVALRVERVFTFKTDSGYTPFSNKHYVMRENTTVPFFSNYLMTYGLLYSNNNSIAKVSYDLADDNNYYVYNYGVSRAKKIMLYDEEKDEIRLASADELYDYDSTGDAGYSTRVLTFTMSGGIYAVYAYLTN